MAAINVYELSGFVSPKMQTLQDEVFFKTQTCRGDDGFNDYHALIGLTGLKVSDPAKIIRILRKAKNAFADINLTRFFQTNVNRNLFKSQLHYEFFKDTIDYIKTGKRSMNIYQWVQLLTVGDRKSGFYKLTHDYIMKPDQYRGLSIQQWVTHKGGLEDMVYCLYIMFGKYDSWK